MFDRWITAVGLAAALAAGALPASAQTLYRCNGSSGTYVSDRPCSGIGDSGRTQLRAIGAVQQPNRYASPSYSPTMAKAGEHLQYMSTECSNLAEGLRTGPARGLKGRALSELSENYRKRAVIASEQCHEMLGALHARRQRAATMTAGEKADLDLFEANYRARCTSG